MHDYKNKMSGPLIHVPSTLSSIHFDGVSQGYDSAELDVLADNVLKIED